MIAAGRRVPARGLDLHALVAVLAALASGALMIAAGSALARSGPGAARTWAVAGGMAIQLALLVDRRGVRARDEARVTGGRAWLAQLSASGCILATGATLAWVGFQSATGSWPAGVALLPALLLLVPATKLNRRAAAIRMASRGGLVLAGAQR